MFTNSLATDTHITEICECQKCKLFTISRLFMWIKQAQGQAYITH